MQARAVSQLLWSDKDGEVWFSLEENHEKTYRSGLHQLRNRSNPPEGMLRLRNDRKLGGVPGGGSARHLDKIGNSVLLQNAGGNRRTVAACTVDSNAAAAGNLRDALQHVVEGNVQAFRYMFGFPLAGIPEVS